MRASVNRGIVGIIAAALVAGCAGHSGLMPAQSTQGLASISAGSPVSPDACSKPKILKVCLKAGATYRLHITLTCYLGSQPASCGTVTWSTKMSNKLLKGKFKPNPANPTVETITAARTIKVGHYSQEINATCTGVPGCNYTQKGLVWIVN